MLPSPLQEYFDPLFTQKKIRFFIKRDDLIHPFISGNKWRKLNLNIVHAKKYHYNSIISFGGAFSNHIYSLAAAGKFFNIKTIGIIRGEEADGNNPTLRFAIQQGMTIEKVSREAYRDKNTLLHHFSQKYTNAYFVPEGGSNELGTKGCEKISEELSTQIGPDFTCVPVGTGGTISGIINGSKGESTILGFPVLKGVNYLEEEINNFTNSKYSNWYLVSNYHFGGYAKINSVLINFMDDFLNKHNIQLDPIYTSKMMFGIVELLKQGYFPENSKIVAIHTGGLQGLEGMKTKIEKLRSY